VVLRRLADGAELRRFRPGPDGVPAEQGRPVLFDFSPDGRRLSVRHIAGALAVWDLESGRLNFVQDADRPRRQASRGLFSSDGQFVVAPGFSPDGFGVVDAATGRRVAHFPEIGSFHHAAVRPGARQFAAFDGGKVLVLDWETRARLLEVPLDFGAYRLAWSPDGRWLGIFGNSLAIQLWDVQTGQKRLLQGHQDVIFDACFDPAGERLAGMSYDGASRLWSLRDGRILGMSTDGRMLRWGAEGRAGWLMPGRRLEVWQESLPTSYAKAPAPAVPADPQQLAVSPDGQWAIGVTDAQDGLLAWPLDPAGPPQLLPLSQVQAVCFEPPTARLLVIRNHRLETFEWTVKVAAGRTQFVLGDSESTEPVPGRWLDRVTCSANGQTRAFSHLLGGVVWVQHRDAPTNIVTLQELQHHSVATQGGNPHGAGALTLSPDGRWLVCGADGHGARVFDTFTGQPVRSLTTRTGGVQFSPDGRWLVLNGAPECILFRTADWSEVWRKPLGGFIHQSFGSVAFAPDGSRVAFVTVPGRMILAETGSGRELAALESPSGSPLVTLRWSPGVDQLVASTREHALDLWRPGALQRELAGLGLDWAASDRSAGSAPAGLPASAGGRDRTAGWIALGTLVTAGIVAAIALLSLRRHRRLIEDFSRTEALALGREQELQIEREVGRLKSSFVSMVSHEFRTPLGITMSAVELLRNYRDRLPSGKQDELLGDIHDSTRQMSDLMEQVLLLGRVEAGKLGCKPAPLDLLALAEKLADETVSATRLKCPVHVRAEGELAGAHADESLVRHILGNLVANAVKYSSPGTPVELLVRRAGDAVELRVRDRGIGIPEADLPQLFQAFSRASNVGDIPGSGLGLVIVKRCADLHGGAITVKSHPGEGTEFTVRLPAFGHPAWPASPGA
jgi:signal transduction histidine kinase